MLTNDQIQLKLNQLEQLVKSLLAPKSKPRLIVGADVEIFYKYTLTGASVATIYSLVNGSAGPSVATNVTVYDPLGMFGDQTTGDSGYCFKQRGYYYRIQAPCTT